MKPIRITHVITGLSIGGAEKVLLRLVRDMDSDAFDNKVISLTDIGPLGAQLQDSGITVNAMKFEKGAPNIGPIAALGRTMRNNRPDLVQTWMYHADLIGGLTANWTTNAPILWNLRQSTLDPEYSKPSTIRTARTCSRLSYHIPNTIVCGSESARLVHTDMGYDFSKMVVLHNGFDTDRYVRCEKMRKTFRDKLGIPEDTILIGNPSRYDPQKDHKTFIEAAALVASRLPNVHFVLCGDQIDENNAELMSSIKANELQERTHILGVLEDLTGLYSAMDLLSLSSAYGEGAPNVLGEAMSARVPCVATEVGDSAYIIGDTGTIVPPRDPKALSEALIDLAQLSNQQRIEMGEKARERIVQNFPLPTMVQRYENLYRRVYGQIYDF